MADCVRTVSCHIWAKARKGESIMKTPVITINAVSNNISKEENTMKTINPVSIQAAMAINGYFTRIDQERRARLQARKAARKAVEAKKAAEEAVKKATLDAQHAAIYAAAVAKAEAKKAEKAKAAAKAHYERRVVFYAPVIKEVKERDVNFVLIASKPEYKGWNPSTWVVTQVAVRVAQAAQKAWAELKSFLIGGYKATKAFVAEAESLKEEACKALVPVYEPMFDFDLQAHAGFEVAVAFGSIFAVAPFVMEAVGSVEKVMDRASDNESARKCRNHWLIKAHEAHEAGDTVREEQCRKLAYESNEKIELEFDLQLFADENEGSAETATLDNSDVCEEEGDDDTMVARKRYNVNILSAENLYEINVQELVESKDLVEKDAKRLAKAFCTYKVVNMADIDYLPLSAELKAFAKRRTYIPVDEKSEDDRPVNLNFPTNKDKEYIAELCRAFSRKDGYKVLKFRSMVSGKDLAHKFIRNPYLLTGAGIAYETINSLVMAGRITAVKIDEAVELNVNTASIEELTALDGIGVNYATRIVMAVKKNPVSKIEDLVTRKVIAKAVLDKAMATEGWTLVVAPGSKSETLRDAVIGIMKSGNHKNYNSLIKAIKRRGAKGMSTVVCRKLIFKVDRNVAGHIAAISTVTSMPYSMVNERYVDDTVREFTLSNGYQYSTNGKLNSDKMLAVSFAIGRGDEDAEAMINMLKSATFYVARTKKDGRDMYLVEVPNADGNGTKLLSLNQIVESKDEYGRRIGAYKEYPTSILYNADGSFKDTVFIVSNGKGAIFSTSQGRKDDVTFFSCRDKAEEKFFEEAMDYATFGEYSTRKNHKGEVDKSVLVDALTRLSSHTTGMGSTLSHGVCLDSITVLFHKDDNIDGLGYMRASAAGRVACQVTGAKIEEVGGRNAARLLGSQLQVRPVTCKATAQVASDAYCDMYESKYNILVIKAYEKILKKQRLHLNRILIKNASGDTSAFKGYDGVRIVYSKTADHTRGDLIAERNFVKDAWDYNCKTGLNVLLAAHFDGRYDDIYTSGQMLKIFAALAKKNGPEAVAKFNEICKGLVDNAILQTTDWDEIASRANGHAGFEEVDTSYTAGLVRNLKKDELFRYPFLMPSVIDDAANVLSRYAQLNRYPICGHTGMFSIDPTYALLYSGLDSDKIEELAKAGKLGIVRQGNNFMEVYDPVANEFFDKTGASEEERIGFLLKYPCMGTCETGVIRYLSDDIIIDRLCALADNGVSDDTILALAVEFANLKEGSVFLPAYLEGIGDIWAGSDRDGDKGAFVFHVPGEEDLTWFLVNYGFKSIAVNIGKPSAGDLSYEGGIDSTAFNNGFIIMSQLGNEKVGPTTNSVTILLHPLMKEFTTKERDIYCTVFNDAFEVGSGIKKGESAIDYVSHIEYAKDIFGNNMAKTAGDATKLFYDALANMEKFNASDESWNKLLDVLHDVDVLGRHCQELIIDAAKKFYEVYTPFVAQISRSMTLTNMKFACEISADWKSSNPVYALHTGVKPAHINHAVISGGRIIGEEEWDSMDGVISQKPIALVSEYTNKSGEHHIQTVIPDFMAPIRAYAVEQSIKALNAMVADYFEAKSAYDNVRTQLANNGAMAKLSINSKEAKTAIDTMIEQARTAVRAYYDRKEALNLEYDFESLSETEVIDADTTIRQTLHAEFDELMSSIDNMFRIIMEKHNIGVETLMDVIFASEKTENAFAGKILKAETARAILKGVNASERLYTPMEDKSILEKAIAGGVVKVSDGKVYGYNKDKKSYFCVKNVYANVADGAYQAAVVDGEPSVVRPITDFITVPEADYSTIVVPVHTGNVEKLQEVQNLRAGDEVSLVVKSGKFTKVVININGEDSAEVHNGYRLPISNMTGKVKTIVVSERSDKKYTYLVLEDVVETSEPVSAASNNNGVTMPAINPNEVQSAESILSGF